MVEQGSQELSAGVLSVLMREQAQHLSKSVHEVEEISLCLKAGPS